MNQSQCENRRHYSVLNPSTLQHFQVNSLLSNAMSNNTSFNNSNYKPSVNYPKMNLQPNSLFAYQEFDQFSSFLENSQVGSTFQMSTANNILNDNSFSGDSFCDSDMSEDKDFPPIQTSSGKRMSEIMPAPFYSNNGFFLNNLAENNREISQSKTMRNPPNKNQVNSFQRNYNQTPVSLQANINQMNSQRRSSLAGIPCAMLDLNLIQNQLRGKPNSLSKFNSDLKRYQKPVEINTNSLEVKELITLKYLFQNVSMLLRDQVGCRQIQDKLEEMKGNEEFITEFFKKIEQELTQSINDKFGNYVIQKLLEILIDLRLSQLIGDFFHSIQSDLFTICLNNYGTLFIQKSLEKLDNGNYSSIETPMLNSVFKSLLDKHLFDLCIDKNGNHVFQKIIKVFPKEKNAFIFEEINQYVIEICKLKQGVIIFQAVFSCSTLEQKEMIIQKILKDINGLINHEYGNYIVHYIVRFNLKEFNAVIYSFVKENVVSLSKLKFSSNVIDKLIGEESSHSFDLIQFILENKLVKELISDQFGNYVIQKALNITKGNTFMSIIHQITPLLDSLKRSGFGKKIYENLMHKYGKYLLENLKSKSKSNISNENEDNEEEDHVTTVGNLIHFSQ